VAGFTTLGEGDDNPAGALSGVIAAGTVAAYARPVTSRNAKATSTAVLEIVGRVNLMNFGCAMGVVIASSLAVAEIR